MVLFMHICVSDYVWFPKSDRTKSASSGRLGSDVTFQRQTNQYGAADPGVSAGGEVIASVNSN